jgi:hypothetical protein
MAYSITAPTRVDRIWKEIVPPRGLMECFIIVQLLWGVLLFIPGAQTFRPYIRALPYVSSLALFAFYYGGRKHFRPTGMTKLIGLAMLLLVLNLAHPRTQLMAGLAQCVFQFSIAAPVFWAGKAIRNPRFLNRLLWLIFVLCAANALVGLLQIYFPEQLMPPEFSSLAQSMDKNYLEAMTYQGSGGRTIIRPPGLSDLPGGAAVAGMMTGVMGIVFSMRREWGRRTRFLCLTAAGVGMVTLYMTQVRSFFIMMVAAIVALCVVVMKRGLRWEGAWIAVTTATLIVISFTWALTIGGAAISDRFMGMAETGLINSIQVNRGIFIEDTFNNLLYEYPLGAGVGRWGMMNVYFANPNAADSQPLWAEIQMTGWLFDGGVLMWLFYGGAILAALLYCYRQAVTATDRDMTHASRMVLCISLIIAGTSFAGPSFNTQLGIQFWFLVAALNGSRGTHARVTHVVATAPHPALRYWRGAAWRFAPGARKF